MDEEMVSFGGRSYRFLIQSVLKEPDIQSQWLSKRVLLGYFAKETPDGLTAGKIYCLKQIRIKQRLIDDIKGLENDPTRLTPLAHPANRQYFDLLDFKGAHLRRILKADDNTAAFRRVIGQYSAGTQSVTDALCCALRDRKIKAGCYCVVEERCQTLETEDILEMTIYERIDYLYQLVLALQELYEAGDIQAHRDTKLGNALVRRGIGSFGVRLIDLASVQERNGSATYHSCLMSPTNTAPELTDGDLFEVLANEQTDVFALGGLLAQMFMKNAVNPLMVWFNGWKKSFDAANGTNSRANPGKALSEEYARLKARFCSGQDPQEYGKWLEALVDMPWDTSVDADLLQTVRELYRSWICLIPEYRPLLSEVRVKLEELLRNVPKVRSDSQKLYFSSWDAYLFDGPELSEQYQLAIEKGELDAPDMGWMAFLHSGGIDTTISETARERAGLLDQYAKEEAMCEPGRWKRLSEAWEKMWKQPGEEKKRIFSGTVHIFMPDLPRETAELCAVLGAVPQWERFVFHTRDNAARLSLKNVEFERLPLPASEIAPPRGAFERGKKALFIIVNGKECLIGKKEG